MDNNHVFTEILYEYKRSRRNVIFRIFVILGIVGITLYMFTPLSRLGSTASIGELFRDRLWTGFRGHCLRPFPLGVLTCSTSCNCFLGRFS